MTPLQPYLDNPAFTPEEVSRASSAAEGLCKWVRAVVQYYHVSQMIEPKKAALKESTLMLSSAEKVLAAKKEQLQVITDHIDAMMADLNRVSAQKQQLEDQVSDCEKRIARAAKLMDGLEGEKERYACSSLLFAA